MVNLGIKDAVKEWMAEKYENWIKQPVERKTLELESFVRQQVNKASHLATPTAKKPKKLPINQLVITGSKKTFIEAYSELPS